MDCFTVPYRHWIVKQCDEFPLAAPLDCLPGRDDPRWEARYDNDCESGKRTLRDLTGIPELKKRWDDFVLMVEPDILHPPIPRVELDPTTWGGGLHVTEPGGWLNCHLDFDRCPKIPTHRRALNAIGFLNQEWKPEWGGAFCLYNPAGEVVKRIYPEPGMVLAFECSDVSYHGVEKVTGPVERVTLAAYYLAEAGPTNTRTRALFMTTRKPR